MHPLKLSPPDSVPRFAWGKYRQEGDKIIMPLSVQGHHAVMDGLHAGKFYEEFQRLVNLPDLFLSGV
jgi:chloramphenicol O-acetyltransferase type A